MAKAAKAKAEKAKAQKVTKSKAPKVTKADGEKSNRRGGVPLPQPKDRVLYILTNASGPLKRSEITARMVPYTHEDRMSALDSLVRSGKITVEKQATGAKGRPASIYALA
jgi:hypothetical protein